MPEVSGSSSHVASAAKTAAAFDLETQQGIANLLKQLRTSSLSAQTKTTIREMVLKYAQTGGDSGVRDELEAILSSLALIPGSKPAAKDAEPVVEVGGEKPADQKPEPKPTKPFGFSGSRPVPSFDKPKSPKTATSPAQPPVVTPTPAVQNTAGTTTVPPVAAAPAVEPLVQPTPASSQVPTLESVSTPVAEKSSIDRILEIKREVITLVGNPVNLVDIDNAVGKQYMTSLLEAMKKTNSGTKEEATQAMANLEKAFVAVKGVAERGIKPDFEPSPNHIPVTHVNTTTLPVQPEQPIAEPATPAPQSESVIPTPVSPLIPQGIKENLVQDEEMWKKVAAEQVSESVDTQVVPSEKKEERQLGGMPLQDIPTYGFSRPARSVGIPQKLSPPVPPTEREIRPTPPPPPISQDTSATSVKVKSATLHHAETSEDLMTPDITIGLTQLLSEWKIFKGSGLFGMGPGGIDHPLYVSIKDNTMISIMNGTFTGATGEIQQSINDYINGWRYEQSIVPQHSETFDHFLRRVVRKVLKDAKR